MPRSLWWKSSAGRWSEHSAHWSRICCNCGWRWGPPGHEPAVLDQRSSLLSRLLMAVGALCGAVAASRMIESDFDVGIPVLCIGTYHVGGAGKTPATLALVRLL